MPHYRVLNLGAGTQSSVLALMCDRGDLPPVDVAIFADTQAEPKAVYDHLEWLKKQLRNTKVVTVTAGNLKTEAIEYQKYHVGTPAPYARYASLPLYTLGGIQNRQCTKYYKIFPAERYVMETMLGVGYGKRVKKGTVVTMVFGISFDERERMRRPHRRWIINEYPLVDLRWNRHRVIAEGEKMFPGHKFPRSACKFCPWLRNEERLQHEPQEHQEACEFDDLVRRVDKSTGVWIHPSLKPLRDVDLHEEDSPLFGMVNECEGMCGV
ncbi:MAG: hypothetical protein ABFD89_03715 [Bryobacteraceae bacterium]